MAEWGGGVIFGLFAAAIGVPALICAITYLAWLADENDREAR